MQAFFDYLNTLNLFYIFLLFLIENTFIAVVAVVLGFAFDGLLKQMNQMITKKEIYWASSTVFFNTLVTCIGYILFKYGYITFDIDFSISQLLLDFVLLIFAMDFLMYLFHWAIHKIHFIYKYHDLHHHYNEPTAISLFVLHPVEVMGFGMLWFCLLVMMNFSIYAVILYLIFNVVMGIIGHLRKEIVPTYIKNNILLQWLANTAFHVDHHQNEDNNFGFYTKLWDRIFGTLK